MRRVRYYAYGGPEVLVGEEAETPTPGEGQVLVRAEAIGVNFVDTRFRRGPASGPLFARELPGRPTGDVVGVVEAVGPGADPGWAGRRVAALAEDAYAEYALADAEWLTPVPDGMAAGDASALPLAGPLALGLLRTARLAPGETVLVHSAAGGVGHLAVQIARLLGAGTVIGTASAAKLDFVRSLGADLAVDYTVPDWTDRIPGPVDVVLDAAGGPILRDSLDLLAPCGRAVVYGAAIGDFGEVPLAKLVQPRSVTGFAIMMWRQARPAEARRDMDDVATMLADGRLRTTVHATLPLDDAATAHRLIEERNHPGRILLLPKA